MDAILQDGWKRACLSMRNEMTDISFKTWIGVLTPYDIIDYVLYLVTVSEFNKRMTQKYIPTIQAAVKSAMDHSYDISIITQEECLELERNRQKGLEEENAASMLNPKYTFDTFIVGKSNQFANAASLAVAESPANAYNPLFLYGGVGLGKTHLMHAIGHFIRENNPELRLKYVTSEVFTNELIASIQSNTNEKFRNNYRSVDVLMIDDVQFIAGKASTQEEFFHTFNTLHSSDKQIIISSDRPPREIERLEERLRSRFEWGLIADIQRPDYETRVAILNKKAEQDAIEVPVEALAFIAGEVESNIRELEGSLTRVLAYARLHQRELTEEVAREALRDVLPLREEKKISCSQIQLAIAHYFNLDTADMKSKKRNRDITLPRQMAMYLTREITDLSLPKIGDEFGGRDHTTVIHACTKISTDMKTDPRLRSTLADIRRILLES